MIKLRNKLFILFLVIISFSFSISVQKVKADTKTLLISQFKINSEILKNGDMKVAEDITFTFSGDFNGVTKEIILPEEAEIEDITISQDNKKLNRVNSANKGDRDVFTTEQNNNSIILWIYLQCLMILQIQFFL